MDTNYKVMKKDRSIQKSIRISQEVADIIEKTDGDSTNDKLNNLVLYCYAIVPDIEKRIQWLKDDQQKELEKLRQIQKRIDSVRSLIGTLESLEHYGKIAERQIKNLSDGLDESGRKVL